MGILHPDQEEYLLPKVCDLKGTKISTMAKNNSLPSQSILLLFSLVIA